MDLSQLMNTAPTTAGFFTGQQIARDRDADLLKQLEQAEQIRSQQQQYAFNDQMNPLKLASQQGANAGQLITNQGNQQKVDFTTATQPTAIKAANAKAQGDISEEHIKQAQRVFDVFGRAAYETQGMPEMQRVMRMQEVARGAGFDPNDEGVKALMQMEPGKLIEIQNRMKADAAKHHPSVVAQGIAGQNSLAVAQENNRGAGERNNAQISAGKYANRQANRTALSELFKNADPKRMYPALKHQATLAYQAYQKNPTEANKETYEDLYFQMEQMEPDFRAAMDADAKPGSVNLPGTTNNRVQANPPVNVKPPGLPAPGARPPMPQSAAPAKPTQFSGRLPDPAIAAFKQNLAQAAQSGDQAAIQRHVQMFNQTFGAGAAESLLPKK
jgi:hypothetical protein